MDHENRDDGLIRRYLLAQLAEDELERLEERMMADNELFNRVLLAEDEMVEEYVQKQLSEQDRFRFEASFLATEAGRRQVAVKRALYEYTPSGRERQKRSKHWAGLSALEIGGSAAFKGAAMVAVVVAVVWVVWFLWIRDDPVAAGRAALVALYSNQRPTHSRVSGFEYAPFVELMGEEGPSSTDRARRDRAGLLVQNAANKRPDDYRAIHLLGQYYLSIGDFDEAINQLRRAHELAPSDATILSDLGGALLEKTRSQGLSSATNPLLDECLKSLNQAIAIKPSLAEAYFNRALCNELLMQWQSAEADWRSYLQHDSTSPWADEAREGLQRIEEQKRKSTWYEPQIFDDFVSAAGKQDAEAGWSALRLGMGTRSSPIVERLIDESVNDQTGGDGKHSMLLKWAGQIVLAKVGDRLVSDIAERYAGFSRSELEQLREARRRSSEGVSLFGDWKLRDARKAFEDARLQFEKLGDSAEELYAQYLEAQCCLRIPDLEAAGNLFNDLSKAARSKSYRWLESRAHEGLAELHFSRSEYSRAIEFARQALDVSRSLNNGTCIGRSCVQLSEIYLRLGDYDEAGKYAWEGLQTVNTQPVDPLQSSLPYEAAADLFTATRQQGLAMVFQVESLRRAESAGYSAKISFANAHVGRLYAALGDRGRAFEHIQRAAEVAATLPEAEGGDVRAFASLCAADLYRGEGDLDRAISSYEEALRSYVQSGRHNLAFAARMGKLLCHIKSLDVAEATAEMASISSLIEQFSGEIVEEKNRVLFTEGLNEFHDAAIEFAYSTLGDGNLAYQYAEMFRARSLYDLATGPWESAGDHENLKLAARSAPLTPEKIMERFPKDAQLVQYAVLDDKSLAWVVSEKGIETREIPVSEEELTDRVKRFIDLCRRPEAVDVTAEAAALYEILIKPIEDLLNLEKQLCIVPDNVLNGLPFVALKSPRTNRYLIEDHVISSAPSSSLFVKCSDWALRKRSASGERVLSVGDPEFDQIQFKLNRLPDAARSASAIADLYPSRTTLIAARASERAVITAMSQAEVINLATHYWIDKRSPMLSKLLLSADAATASSPATDGALQGYELYDLRLPRAKLAVLAGCQTLGDAFFNFEGAVGAARPFISAGVPLVVASLWPVDVEATAELVLEFHRQRKPGVNSSAKALQAAQLKLIRSGYRQSPFYWAGFSLIGGYADF
jgi:CHAT domain-containing protein/lipopolysaccharide biosynthesis regulator YciM